MFLARCSRLALQARHGLTALLLAPALVTGQVSPGSTAAAPSAATPARLVVPHPALRHADQDAARFLHQASFGPSPRSLAEFNALGIERWMQRQWSLPPSSVRGLQAQAFALRGSPRDDYRYLDVQSGIWTAAIDGEDQLRQRVAWALSQTFVISVVAGDPPLHWFPEAAADYWDTLARHADGNFRHLIEAVALHPQMGMYLSHLGNRREDVASGRLPDQNFARELLQLFGIGPVRLRADGTPWLDAQGQPIESYGQADIEGLSSVFTGWSFDAGPGQERFEHWHFFAADLPPESRWRPMRLYPAQHSPSAKTFLGTTVPAGTDGRLALGIALDRIAGHPNVGPFFGRQLIQRLVTSNPSPAYVARVAAVFDNNGAGVRGDLRAVVRAVLVDREARVASMSLQPHAGRLKEPLLRVTNLYRAIQARPAQQGWAFGWTWGDDLLGQAPMSAPSVFNFHRPGYVPPGSALAARSLVSPELQISNEISTLGWAHQARALLDPNRPGPAAPLALSAEAALAHRPEALLARLETYLLGGPVSARTRELILRAVASVNPSEPDALRTRVRIALTLLLASPDYLVQK